MKKGCPGPREEPVHHLFHAPGAIRSEMDQFRARKALLVSSRGRFLRSWITPGRMLAVLWVMDVQRTSSPGSRDLQLLLRRLSWSFGREDVKRLVQGRRSCLKSIHMSWKRSWRGGIGFCVNSTTTPVAPSPPERRQHGHDGAGGEVRASSGRAGRERLLTTSLPKQTDRVWFARVPTLAALDGRARVS